MDGLIWPGLFAWGAICSVWMVLLLAQRRIRREGLQLRPSDAGDRCAGSVAVVIPMRNEQRHVEACLRRVLAQSCPDLSVIVVDDRSDDATAAIVRALAEEDPRVRLVHVDALPPGWLAKSHALWQGTRQATGDWLAFIDADCSLHPQAIITAVREAERRGVDLITLWPRNAAVGFWEHLLIPLCGGIIALWFGGIRGTDRTPAFANGQFLLMRREAYERIDGHRAVRSALIEDVPLAEHARALGLRCWTGSGRDLVGVRMYDSFHAVRDGWARIFVGALRSRRRILLSIVWLLAGSLLPFLALGPLIWGVLGAWPDPPLALVAALVLCVQHLALIAIVSHRFWGLGGCRRRYLWLYPLTVVLVAMILVRSFVWLGLTRRVSWRGTTYAIDRRARLAATDA